MPRSYCTSSLAMHIAYIGCTKNEINSTSVYLKPAFCLFKTSTTYAFRLFVNDRGIANRCTNPDCVVLLPIVFIIASAGRHQTCLPSWRIQSSALVYARYVSLEILWGSKVKKFSWSLLARHLYQKQLARERS